jgi:hypothetical protein
MNPILVCIDDTDNLNSRGTGELASLLAEQIEQKGWGSSSFVTRHQLLIHPEIPYTSHNSAMCFAALLQENCSLPRFIEHTARFLEQESASGSDPGLCVAVPDRVSSPARLIAFGLSAKQEVLNKEAAYALARQLGVHLSEHGGSGQGVIGALAGVGLRLGGNDGRLRGQLPLGTPGETRTVSFLRGQPLIEVVRALDGTLPTAGEKVELGEKIKTVLLEGKSVLLVESTGASAVPWRTCSRRQLRNF